MMNETRENKVLIHAALDPRTRDFLKKRADKERRTFSAMVDLALERWVEIEKRKEARK